MKVIVVLFCIIHSCPGRSNWAQRRNDACRMLHTAIVNESRYLTLSDSCEEISVPHAESISGGYCLASMTSAGYYRAGSVNPVANLLSDLLGDLGTSPAVTGTNSGGTMFAVRYFSFRDVETHDKWTYPCYLLRSSYRNICYFHGNFGLISEECYSETQNIINAATGAVYGGLQNSNGGPLGIVASYCSVYFAYLSNLPIPSEQELFTSFWTSHHHWNSQFGQMSDWEVAYSVISPIESSGTAYNYGFENWLPRGMSGSKKQDWYSNMSVYTVASISANTLSGISLIPFAFAGKEWDASGDAGGGGTALKILGLLLSYTMVKKLKSQHTVMQTVLISQCEVGCPLLDGGFTDNGPITMVLAQSSEMTTSTRPRHLSMLGPMQNMGTIHYLMGVGSFELWTAAGLNLCPFTQVSICSMISQARTLLIPLLPFSIGEQYKAISHRYRIYRPEKQILKPYCPDPLVFDRFKNMCMGDSICHMCADAVPGVSTKIKFSATIHIFILSMLWLAPNNLAARFVDDYIPQEMLNIEYYSNMRLWFPDFVATAPQKGGIGFTKVAGHSLLDYLTYLVERLTATEVQVKLLGNNLYLGEMPPCGYKVFTGVRTYNQVTPDQSEELM